MCFNAEKTKKDLVEWIRNWFVDNGNGCKAVIAISGGKDSSVVAALCVEALGKDRVFGVLLPNGEQADIHVSKALVEILGIDFTIVNIKDSYDAIIASISKSLGSISEATRINLAPRLRMSVSYAIAQSVNGRVANTCNLSEDWVGYATKHGDAAGDFSPLSQLTVSEVKALGRCLGLPSMFVDKVPTDGLCGKTDEDNLGFTYDCLDNYIRTGVCPDNKIKERIDSMHKKNLFKLLPMDSFPYKPE